MATEKKKQSLQHQPKGGNSLGANALQLEREKFLFLVFVSVFPFFLLSSPSTPPLSRHLLLRLSVFSLCLW